MNSLVPVERGAVPGSDSAPIALLLNASSVAILGASNNPVKISGRPLKYLSKYGFEGRIYPVNPTRDVVQGLKSYPSVEDLPEVPDVAVIVLPASGVEEAIRACGRVGVRFAIVFASGYSELGPEGQERQRSLTAVAAEAGVRILGPNSVGAVSARNGLTATFMTGLDQDRFELRDQGVAFVSQSGAMGGFILNMAQSTGIGVGCFLSTGNEADLSMSELLLELAEDVSTRVILAYIEGIEDGREFQQALDRCFTAGIPVCIVKVGRSDRGAAAAASHTGSLAGSDSVFDGVFARHGVLRAESVEELLDLARVFSSPKRPAGRRVSIVTLSGGAGVLMADYAEELGLDVFDWSEEWKEKMRASLPSFASVTNPIDITGGVAADLSLLETSLRVSLDNPDTDLLMVLLGNLEAEEDAICDIIRSVARDSPTPVLVTWVGGSGNPTTILADAGVPAFSDPVRAMKAASALARWSLHEAGSEPPDFAVEMNPAEPRGILEAATASGRSSLNEVESKALLNSVGFPTVREAVADSANAAVELATALGYPVVLKLLADEITHKSDIGGVKLGLNNEADVRTSGAGLLETADRLGVRQPRLLVQPEMSRDVELILGMKSDPVFGPVVMIGIGGIFAEVLGDVQVRPAPISSREALEMIGRLRGVALLRGARGRTPVDEDLLADLISRFSVLSESISEYVDSIDVNPLMIGPNGAPIAVDALVVLRSARESARAEGGSQ